MELQCKSSEKELARFSEAQPEVGVAKVRTCGAPYVVKDFFGLLAAKLFLSCQHEVSTKRG